VELLGKSSPRSRAVTHFPLGTADYGEVLSLQRELRERRSRGSLGDAVITVEHNPVFTIGRLGSYSNLLVSREVLDTEGIQLFEVERGGDITYHGPGQLVVYPIIDLRDYGRDVRAYVDRLEEATIRTLHAFGIEGRRESGHPGVWVDGRKVASIGVYVRRWITSHGLAINVDVDPRHFAMIRPCGLPVRAVSMAEVTEERSDVSEVRTRFLDEASALFGWSLKSLRLTEIGSAGDGHSTRLD
jgi:lipoic acid synthetase